MKMIKSLLGFVVILGLSNCSNAPSHIIISPKVTTPAQNTYQGKNTQFHVTDLRTAHHLIQIIKEDEAAKLMTSQKKLVDVVSQTLQSEYKKQGMMFNQSSINSIDVLIDKALINVKQDTLSYEAYSTISFRVKVNNTQQTLTQTFNSRSTSSGPLTADIAVLERDFSQQLSSALASIITNEEIAQFIK